MSAKRISKTVVVLFDGYVHNSRKNLIPLDVSSVLQTVSEVEIALKNNNYDVVKVAFEYPFSKFAVKIKNINPLIVFNLCETVGGDSKNEYIIPAILKALNINFTGSGATCLANCLEKVRTKTILQRENIPTPRFFLAENANFKLPDSIRFPLIIKPAREDGSVGIYDDSVARREKDLTNKVRHIISEFEQPALIEEFLNGREFNVSILDGQVLPISEIDFTGIKQVTKKIVSYKAKWDEASFMYNHTKPVCPAVIDTETKNKIFDLSLKAYRTLNCRNYARVDMRTNKSGELFVLEVNPNPDISQNSGFARSCKATGLSYDEMINRIITSAINSEYRIININKGQKITENIKTSLRYER